MTEKNTLATVSPAGRGAVTAVRKPTIVPSSGNQRFWLEVLLVRSSRWLGSLQIAVLLLASFALVLALGTIIESEYSARIAQEVVYRAWWFKLLLFLLGINIFFAAAKKWPWKKYQTGFLITHLGLLLLVAGGMVTSFSSTDGFMSLIDSAQADVQRANNLAQSSDRIILSDDGVIRVISLGSGKDHGSQHSFRFDSGPLAWRSDEYLTKASRPLLDFLGWLAHPWPRHWQEEVAPGVQLEVLGYYPHARQEEFSPVKDEDGVPALKVELKSPMFGTLPRQPWLALDLRNQVASMQVASLELIGRCSDLLLNEFLQPPSREELGKCGAVALAISGKTYRFPVDACPGDSIKAGDAFVKFIKFYPDYKDRDAVMPSFPALEFSVSRAGRTTNYMTLARYAGVAIPVENGKPSGKPPTDLAVWYHPPDYRFGQATRGILQFAVDTSGKLYYRSFHTSTASGFAFEGSGPVQAGNAYPIWKGMNWEFRVKEYLPQAIAKTRYIPQDARPGLQKEPVLTPVIRCQLKNGSAASDEFWVSQNGPSSRVELGHSVYDIRYGTLEQPLGFDFKLLRAEQTVDASTQQAATFTSYVQVDDDGEFSVPGLPKWLRGVTNFLGLTNGGQPLKCEDLVITMNQPLNHRGYKVYQSNYDFVSWDANERPVSLSGFAVGHDPGLPFKYVGSSMLALGISCMFYMKAYFFKPRRRA
jgi:hypothetical protein